MLRRPFSVRQPQRIETRMLDGYQAALFPNSISFVGLSPKRQTFNVADSTTNFSDDKVVMMLFPEEEHVTLISSVM